MKLVQDVSNKLGEDKGSLEGFIAEVKKSVDSMERECCKRLEEGNDKGMSLH